jgi:hypothetical protein
VTLLLPYWAPLKTPMTQLKTATVPPDHVNTSVGGREPPTATSAVNTAQPFPVPKAAWRFTQPVDAVAIDSAMSLLNATNAT